MRLRDKIRDAQALARFANLTPESVDYFRNNFMDFAPQDWWTYQPTDENGNSSGEIQWRRYQEQLRVAWEKGFDLDHYQLMRLLTSVFDPNEFFQVMLATHPRPAFASLGEMSDTSYSSDRAVLFLNEQKWRVRLCERCGTPIVAQHNQQKYCSTVWNADGETCFTLERKEQKRRDHEKHRVSRNKKRRAAYARRGRK